jgi:hypothetical protein
VPQKVPIGEPCQLHSKLVPLPLRGQDRRGEAIRERPDVHAFEPAQVISVHDDTLAWRSGTKAGDCHAAKGYINYLTRKFAAVVDHASPEQPSEIGMQSALATVSII